MADEVGNQEQALNPAEAGPSNQPQQNIIASPDEGAERPAKRQRVEEQELDYSYEPSQLCDVIVKCGDGKRIGYSKLVKGVLEEFPEQQEVQVTEDAAELRKHFLDIIYDRGMSITPDMAIHVLNLADKYEAPSVVEACRATLVSPAFKISYEPRKAVPDAGSIEEEFYHSLDEYCSHCTLADALLIASKYKWPDLMEKCIAWLESKSTSSQFRVHTLPHLEGLSTAEIIKVMDTVCKKASESLMATFDEKLAVSKCWEMTEAMLKAKKEIESQNKKNYTKLLSKYNKLLAKARTAGVQT